WYRGGKCLDGTPFNLCKSTVCSRCGPSLHAYCYYSDSSCHGALCYESHSLRQYGDAARATCPSESQYQLPHPPVHAAAVPHGPDAGKPDLSYVPLPWVHIILHGMGRDDDRKAHAADMMLKHDHAFADGLGYYRIEHTFRADHRQ